MADPRHPLEALADESSASSEIPATDRAHAGPSEGPVRAAIGYTGTLDQRWRQFEAALTAMGL